MIDFDSERFDHVVPEDWFEQREREPGNCLACGARLAYAGATSCFTCHRSDADE